MGPFRAIPLVGQVKGVQNTNKIWLSCVKTWYKNSNFLYIGRTVPKSVKDSCVHSVLIAEKRDV